MVKEKQRVVGVHSRCTSEQRILWKKYPSTCKKEKWSLQRSCGRNHVHKFVIIYVVHVLDDRTHPRQAYGNWLDWC